MNKIFKLCIYICLMCTFFITLPACGRKNEIPSQSNKQALIGDVNYSSLTEAVNNAKSGDTIKIYNDLKDNKNVVINKPLSIKGILTSSQIKPKFFGSLTVDLPQNDQTITIENIEIIHSGTLSDGENNDNRIGVNLIDGGLVFKSNVLSLENTETTADNVIGLMITRKISSDNTMPIVISGNRFDNYKTPNNTTSAIIINSNKSGEFKNLNLNENEIYNKNVFSSINNGNQLVSINNSTEPYTFPFLATNSSDFLIKALKNNQSLLGSTFFFNPVDNPKKAEESPVIIDNKTSLTIGGNNEIDLKNTVFDVSGNVYIKTNIKNATFKRTSDTANIIFGEDIKTENVTIV